MTYVIISLLVVLVLLLAIARADATTPPRDEPCVASSTWDGDDSYLYYIDHKGQLAYECANCRGCIENAAERLRDKGFTVTEVVLGTKYSGDL